MSLEVFCISGIDYEKTLWRQIREDVSPILTVFPFIRPRSRQHYDPISRTMVAGIPFRSVIGPGSQVRFWAGEMQIPGLINNLAKPYLTSYDKE
ncbi:hypothetical protein WISP_41679 [Willisornis vidua]|uniref:Uncharacterized protein n=1 Tax=Willisornis vidua TaxID=1566151 RepID=A0ABQ9DMG0_9PASS|nr:hypothetical protein WISP_41679 [Willisornis vidua]